MDEKTNINEGNQVNSIETKIGDYFSELKLNNEQINRIKICLIKKFEGKTSGNKDIQEKITIKKFKKILESSTNIEEGIKRIENEIIETENKTINILNKQDGAKFFNHEELQGSVIIDETRNNQENLVALLTKVSESYTKLDNKYKSIDPKKLKDAKTAISEETKEKLAEKNVTEEQINQYIQYTIIRENIYENGSNDNSLETKDFLRNLKELEDNLGIRTETKKGLPLTVNTDVFQSNPQLKILKDNNYEISELDNIDYFSKENIDFNNPENIKESIKPYKKMEIIYKENKDFPRDEKFQNISKKINEDNFQDLTNEDINYYISKLNSLNGWITDYMQCTAAQAPLIGVLRYLDSYSDFGKDTLADRFGKGKNEYITIDNSTIRIEGIIDGNPLSFYYNIEDGNTSISCDDILHIEDGKYEIYNGTGEYPKSNLKINMPSIKDIVNNLKAIPQEEYIKLLEGIEELKDFQSKITELISNKTKDIYPENQEIKTRMARFTEKNLTAQAFDSAIIGGNSGIKEELNNRIKQPEITPIKRTLLLVDNTTEKNTTTELIEFKESFKELEQILDKSQDEISKIKNPVIKEKVTNLKNGIESRDYNQREKSTIDFFSLFEYKEDTKDPNFKINIDDFSAFIKLAKEDKEINEKELKDIFSAEFIKKYEETSPIKEKNLNKKEQEKTFLSEMNNKEEKTKKENEDRFNTTLMKMFD